MDHIGSINSEYLSKTARVETAASQNRAENLTPYLYFCFYKLGFLFKSCFPIGRKRRTWKRR